MQWCTGTCIVIYRYNGAQVQVCCYLQIQWESGTPIQLLTDTMGNRYTYSYLQTMAHSYMYTVINRDNGKLVELYSS